MSQETTQTEWLFDWLKGRKETIRLLVEIARNIDGLRGAAGGEVVVNVTGKAEVFLSQPQAPFPPLLPSDEAILRSIFAEGNGPFWTDPEARSTWLNQSVPACLWTGVTCEAENGTGSARVGKLDLSRFGMTALSDKVGGLDRLVSLELDEARLESVPDSIGRLRELRVLALTRSQLRSIPETVGQLSNLQYLRLDGNQLQSIPETVGQLTNLLEMWLTSNQLRSIPDTVGQLTKLELMLLTNNQLQSITGTVDQLTHLRWLDLSENQLQSIPETIGRLAGLRGLRLHNNQLRSIPESVGLLGELQTLSVSNNPLAAPLPDLSRLNSLEELLLRNASLTSLPPAPSRSLNQIDISQNSLAGSISLCGSKLETINMNDNPFLTSVASPCGFPSAVSVSASRCGLLSLSFLRDSSRLTDLEVSQNSALGNEPFVLAKAGSWPALQSLRADSTGAQLPVSEVLASLDATRTLISLDISGNGAVYGSLSPPSSSPLYILRLSGTSVSYEQPIASYFPRLRVLSLTNLTLLDPKIPIDQQEWEHLEEVDIQGASPSVKIKDPVAFPGTTYTGDVKFNTFSQCPTHLIGGTRSRYSILADPSTYGWKLCKCIDGYYGEPWKKCLVCPAVPSGETSVTIDCKSTPGALRVTGGWIFFGVKKKAVEVIPCPGDSNRSPCATSALSVSIRNLTEWDQASSSLSRACAEGYEGRLCSRCRPGFFRSGRSCYRCGAKGLSWLNPLLSLVLLTALGVKSVAGGYKSRSGLIRTLIMHAQLVSLLPDVSLRLSDWSGFFVKSSASGSGGLRLNGLECEGKGWDGFYGPFVQAGLLPVVALLGSAWIGLVSGCVGGGRKMSRLDRFKTAMFYLWMVLLFGSMQRLFAPLNCTDYGSTRGDRYLTAALWIRCTGPSFLGLLATSILLGLGYTFGTVALVAYRLRPSTTGTSSISAYLRSPYTQDCYYWEAVQLLRRVALAMAGSLTKLYSPIQPVIVSSILIVSLLAHTWRKPYARPIDNVVESVSLTLLLSSYMAGLIASNPQFPSSATTLISWLFFAVNALFLFALTTIVLFHTGLHRLKTRSRAIADQQENKERLLLES